MLLVMGAMILSYKWKPFISPNFERKQTMSTQQYNYGLFLGTVWKN